MRQQERLLKIQKLKMFSQKQAELLSGFSRDQLRKLDTAAILTPYKFPSILYDWNQLIFLKILYYLRNSWTFKQIESAFKNPEKPIDINFVIDNIQNTDIIYFGEYGKIPDDLKLYIQFNSLITTNELVKKDVFNKMEKFDYIIKDIGELNQGKFTHVNVPKLIKELKVLAQELQIENFDLKVG